VGVERSEEWRVSLGGVGYTNIGDSLSESASRWPDQTAVAEPIVSWSGLCRGYDIRTFRELNRDTDQLVAAMQTMGLSPGTRVALLVPPGTEFITFTFALLKAGAVVVLIDPGMGRRNMLRCLTEAQPEGFVTIPMGQAVRWWFRDRFPKSRLLITVGGRGTWGGVTAHQLRSMTVSPRQIVDTARFPQAAIIFTTGSTGPAKGVLYTHENFIHQVTALRAFYDIRPGGVDVPCFPLFALFNLAMGVTTVFPRMNAARPAQVRPSRIVRAIRDWNADQAFASPAVWNVVGRFCEKHHVTIPSLMRVLSAGAPVPLHVLRRMRRALSASAAMHTPYGATEALPIASISDREVLEETQFRSAEGHGTCVGSRFPSISWGIIRIRDDAIANLAEAEFLGHGEIGELIVQGPVVTREYATRIEANRLAKILDGDRVWHRMGDVGYLDGRDRFWFCGRKNHRVQTEHGPMFTIPCEAIANGHPRVFRSALVPLGAPSRQIPALVVECWPEHRVRSRSDAIDLRREIHARLQQYLITQSISAEHILFHRSLPVDIRHNAKIFREKLAVWATKRLRWPDRIQP